MELGELRERVKVRAGTVQLASVERGKGVPVIFVHGGLDDYRMWDAQLEPFSKNYHVIAYSRRYNFPNKNPLITSDHSAIIEADDLAALINRLKLRRVHLVGHSYGALTALFLAVKHPELVRTLVLAEPPVLGWAQDRPKGKVLYDEIMANLWKPTGDAFRRREPEQALRLTINYFLGEGVLDQVPEGQRKYWMSNMREWQALTTSQDAFPRLNRTSVRRVKVHTLMISGLKTLNVLKFIDDELQSSLWYVERLLVPNASHDMWNEQPEVCRRAVLAFLARN